MSKIFVGGLPRDTTKEDIEQHFGSYGNITRVDMKHGFSFVHFDSYPAVGAVLADYENHTIKDKWVETKQAIDGLTKSGGKGGGGKGGGSSRNSAPATSAPKANFRFKSAPKFGFGYAKPPPPPTAIMPENDESKVFIGGLPKTAGQHDVEELAMRYGPVLGTNFFRGYCFVQFENPQSVSDMLMDGPHEIHNHAIDCKLYDSNAKAKGQPDIATISHETTKIFLGGLDHTASEQDIIESFEQFGDIKLIQLKRDANGESRGFAFIEYQSPISVVAALENYEENKVLGKWVEATVFEERKPPSSSKSSKKVPASMSSFSQFFKKPPRAPRNNNNNNEAHVMIPVPVSALNQPGFAQSMGMTHMNQRFRSRPY